MQPRITTIIPTYRRPGTLKRAIQSVLNQTYPYFQVCVYDDASGDETESVVREFMQRDERVKYYRHPVNVGSNANFQYGLESVTTPYFSFLADDDFLLPNFYETTLEGFVRHPEIAFCSGQTFSIHPDGTINHVEPEFEGERLFLPPDGALEFLYGAIPNWTAILFKKELVDTVGSFNRDLFAIDIDLLGRIAIAHSFLLKAVPCAVFLIHAGSISYKADVDAHFFDMLGMIHRLKGQPGLPVDFGDKFEEVSLKRLENSIFTIGLGQSAKNNFKMTRRAAQILAKEFNQRTKSLLLHVAGKCSEKMPNTFEIFYQFLRKTYRFFKPRSHFSKQHASLIREQLKRYGPSKL